MASHIFRQDQYNIVRGSSELFEDIVVEKIKIRNKI